MDAQRRPVRPWGLIQPLGSSIEEINARYYLILQISTSQLSQCRLLSRLRVKISRWSMPEEHYASSSTKSGYLVKCCRPSWRYLRRYCLRGTATDSLMTMVTSLVISSTGRENNLFVTLIAEAIPEHLHGYISRFLTEVHAGVYVGKSSKRVADRLWERAVSVCRAGRLVMVISDSSYEQGFSVRSANDRQRSTHDFEGLWLTEFYHQRRADNRVSDSRNS